MFSSSFLSRLLVLISLFTITYMFYCFQGQVTSVKFLETQKNVVVSCSKDTFVKFWDLTTQHCFKTLTGHLGEIWDMVLIRDEELLVTGGADSELRVWSLKWVKEESNNSAKRKLIVPTVPKDDDEDNDNKGDEDEDGSNLTVTRLGSILRKGEGKVGSLNTDKTGRVMVCHGNDNLLEMFVICTQEEIDKRVAKRLKKEKKRTGEEVTGEGEATLQEMVKRVKEIKTGGKLKSADVLVSSAGQVRTLVVLANNLLQLVSLDLSSSVSGAVASVDLSLDQPGHRSVRYVKDQVKGKKSVLLVKLKRISFESRKSIACQASEVHFFLSLIVGRLSVQLHIRLDITHFAYSLEQ